MRQSLMVLVALLGAHGVALAQTQTAGNDIPTISVTGTAEALAAPDEATVRLGIVRQAENAQSAQQQASAVATAIINAVKALGVAEDSIQTSRLTLTPVFAPRHPESRDAPRIVAYQASNVISVRLADLDLTGNVIDAGFNAGANNLEGVSFGLRNDLSARQEAIRKAVQEARAKAQAIAEALGVTLGNVVDVQEGGVSVIQRDFAAPAMLRAEAVSTPVQPGQLSIHATVTVRYRIN